MVGQVIQQVNFMEPIRDLLVHVNDIMRRQAKDRQSDLEQAIEHLLSSGGKRIRPAVALLCGNMLGGPNENLVTLAAAIELLHTATLVHDDLIDGALFRRGNATINSQWTPAATVLTGDFIFACAANLAAETNSVMVMKLFAETLAVIVNGEITQLFNKVGLPTMQDYEKRIYAKTASMFELASAAAAVLSPVDEFQVYEMHAFGKNLGMAFQIVDDILDFTGEFEAVGKPVGSDLRQGIITLPAIYFAEEHPDFPVVKKIISDQMMDNGDIESIVQAIRTSGAIEKSMHHAKEYIQSSKDILAHFPEGIYKQSLDGLLDFIVGRRI